MRRPSRAMSRRWRSAASPCLRTTPISPQSEQPGSCRELREYAAAKQSHEEALAIFRKSLPPDHPDIATSLNNLGIVQYALREYAAAKQSHERRWPSAASPCLRTTPISPPV